MKYWMNVLLGVASAALMTACGGGADGPETAPTERSLAAAASAEPSASEFMKMAQAAGTTERMRADGQLTLIAPSNEAVAEMRAEIDELMLPENRTRLQTFVESHLVAKRMLASDMRTGTETSLSGNGLEVNAESDAAITVNESRIAVANVQARNGVLFVTHKPVWRPNVFSVVKRNPNFSILESAIREAGLTGTLRGDGPFTLLAPTNAAFAALLAELKLSPEQLLADKALLTQVLTYHVLPRKLSERRIGDGATPVTVQGQALTFKVASGKRGAITVVDAQGRQANVVATNLFAGNGVVHVIDKVILPQSKNLVQIAQGSNDFSILVDADVAAGLVDTLNGAGPFTVFAPTNAAFAALLDELKVSKEALLANQALLTQVLTYHVLPGRVLDRKSVV